MQRVFVPEEPTVQRASKVGAALQPVVTSASCSKAQAPDKLELLLLSVVIPQQFLQAGV